MLNLLCQVSIITFKVQYCMLDAERGALIQNEFEAGFQMQCICAVLLRESVMIDLREIRSCESGSSKIKLSVAF